MDPVSCPVASLLVSHWVGVQKRKTVRKSWKKRVRETAWSARNQQMMEGSCFWHMRVFDSAMRSICRICGVDRRTTSAQKWSSSFRIVLPCFTVLIVWPEACHQVFTSCRMSSLMTLSERSEWLVLLGSDLKWTETSQLHRWLTNTSSTMLTQKKSERIRTSSIKPRESVALAADHANGTSFHRWGGIHASHSQHSWLACFTQLSVPLCFKQMQHTINHFYNWCSAVIQCQTQLQLIALVDQSFRNLARVCHMCPRSARAPSGFLAVNSVTQCCIFLVSLKPWH